MQILASLLVVVCTVVLGPVFCWENGQLAEQGCLRNPPGTADNMDWNWFQSVDRWYFPMGSKLDFYRCAAEILQIPVNQVRDPDFYYNFCITFNKGNDTMASYLSGFGQRLPTVPALNEDATVTWKFNIPATATFALTDSRSWAFMYVCWGDGRASWYVASVVPFMEPPAVKKVQKYAKGLGFKEQFFTELKYQQCKIEDLFF